jgi:hypothetical protein
MRSARGTQAVLKASVSLRNLLKKRQPEATNVEILSHSLDAAVRPTDAVSQRRSM